MSNTVELSYLLENLQKEQKSLRKLFNEFIDEQSTKKISISEEDWEKLVSLLKNADSDLKRESWRVVHLFALYKLNISPENSTFIAALELLESFDHHTKGLTKSLFALWYKYDCSQYTLKKLHIWLMDSSTPTMAKAFIANAYKDRLHNEKSIVYHQELLNYLLEADPLSAQIILKLLGDQGTIAALPEIGFLLSKKASEITHYWASDTISRIFEKQRNKKAKESIVTKIKGFIAHRRGYFLYVMIMLVFIAILYSSGFLVFWSQAYKEELSLFLFTILVLCLLQAIEGLVVMDKVFTWIKRSRIVVSYTLEYFIEKFLKRSSIITKFIAIIINKIKGIPINRTIEHLSYFTESGVARGIEKIMLRAVNLLIMGYFMYLLLAFLREVTNIGTMVYRWTQGIIVVGDIIGVSIQTVIFTLNFFTAIFQFPWITIITATLFFYEWYTGGPSVRTFPYGKPTVLQQKKTLLNYIFLLGSFVIVPLVLTSRSVTILTLKLEVFLSLLFHGFAIFIAFSYLYLSRSLPYDYAIEQRKHNDTNADQNHQSAPQQEKWGQKSRNEKYESEKEDKNLYLEIEIWFSQVEGLIQIPIFLAAHSQLEGIKQTRISSKEDPHNFGMYVEDPNAPCTYSNNIIKTPGHFIGVFKGYYYFKDGKPDIIVRMINSISKPTTLIFPEEERTMAKNYIKLPKSIQKKQIDKVFVATMNPNADMILGCRIGYFTKSGNFISSMGEKIETKAFGDWYYSGEKGVAGWKVELEVPLSKT